MNWDVDHYWIEKHVLKARYQPNYIWETLECNTFDPTRCPKAGNATKQMLRDIEKSGKTWGLAYKKMKPFIENEDDLYDIRNIMLANHVEQIVSWVAGHSNVCLFLQCVIHDRYGALYIETEEDILRRQLEEEQQAQAQAEAEGQNDENSNANNQEIETPAKGSNSGQQDSTA